MRTIAQRLPGNSAHYMRPPLMLALMAAALRLGITSAPDLAALAELEGQEQMFEEQAA